MEQMQDSSQQGDDRRARIGPDDVQDLWRRHRRWVAAVLLAHMPEGAELDDLLQEVAMKLVTHIHELRDPDALRPWLRTVAVNAARSAGRRRRTRLRRNSAPARVEATAWSGDEADPARAPDAREEANRLLALARELHPDYAEPLLMRCVRGMSYRQIADALALPVTTVETRLARARRMLRELTERRTEPAAHDLAERGA